MRLCPRLFVCCKQSALPAPTAPETQTHRLSYVQTEQNRTRKRKFSLMFAVYSLIYFVCSLIFSTFVLTFAWFEWTINCDRYANLVKGKGSFKRLMPLKYAVADPEFPEVEVPTPERGVPTHYFIKIVAKN